MTLKIEVGKYYRTRNGQKVGPMLVCETFERDAFMVEAGDGRGWSTGGLAIGGQHGYSEDLIEEWTEGQPLAELDLKPGDVVEWVGFEYIGHHKLDFIQDGFYVFDTPNSVYSHHQHCDDKFRIISRASDLSETAVQPVRDPELTSPYGDNNHPLPEDDKPRPWGKMTDAEDTFFGVRASKFTNEELCEIAECAARELARRMSGSKNV